MPRYGQQVLEQLEAFVEQVEQTTAAELVVVLAHRADRYPEVPYKLGALMGLASLAALLFMPVGFQAHLVLLDVALGFGLGYGIGRLWPGSARWLTSARRRNVAVERTAKAVFTERGVSLTRERTGILLFVAWLERRVVLIQDVGIDRCVPLGEWRLASKPLGQPGVLRDFPDNLPRAFEPLQRLLDRCLPRPDDDTDEIPNRPVVIE